MARGAIGSELATARDKRGTGGVEGMKETRYLIRCVWAVLFVGVALAGSSAAEDLPDYWKGLVGKETTTPEVTATSNVLALNTSMFDLYEASGQIFVKNILANHPVILALFSGSGG